MDKTCHCLVPDENDNCESCGQHIELPDVERPPLGDMKSIFRLIDSTVRDYADLIKENTDPNNPSLTRLRMVGGQMMRIPNRMLYRDLLEPSYKEARKLGYRGEFPRWVDIVTSSAASAI